MSIQVGKMAPSFKLEAVIKTQFGNISLKDYAERWLVLFFYPYDFSFVCPTEILEFSRRHEEFGKLNAALAGCSVDSIYSHLAWVKQLGELTYPLLSDNTREVSKEYGVLIEEQGIALRGLFIIDPEGIVRYQVVHDLDVGRSVDETLRVLQALQTGERCPIGWMPGEKTLGKG